MNRFLLTCALVLFSTAIFSQGTVNPRAGGAPHMTASAQKEDSLFIRRLADDILLNGKAYAQLTVLTKTIGARLSGSPAYYRAEVWGQQALRDAGAGKIYLQACMVPHWVRGGVDSAVLTTLENGSRLKIRSLDVLALGNSVGTGPTGIHAPVLRVSSFEDLRKHKDEAKGKIVFFDYPFDPRQVETFLAYRDAVRYRIQGPAEAARYGAVAVLIRSMTDAMDNNPHTGMTIYNDSFPKIPAAALGLKDADRLAAALRAPGSAPGMQDRQKPDSALQAPQMSVYLRTMARMLPDTVEHSVIGEIRGSLYPNEVITVGGHLDSWDPAEGAQDDGAGCVQSIEVLRVLNALGYKPRHTIRVVLFANEENGLRGAKKYAEEVKAKNEKVLFALESDAGGFTPRAFSLNLRPDKLAALRPWIRLLQPYGVYEFTSNGGGADVEPLAAQGTTVGELLPDSQRYFDLHHSRADVLENVNKRELELGAINMAALIYLADKYGL
jgi:carboxypeptidase Q